MPDFIANMEPHWAWLSLGVLLAAAEIVAPGFFLIWIGAAAIVTGVVAWVVPLSVPLQLGIFAVLSFVALYGGRRWLKANPITTTDPGAAEVVSALTPADITLFVEAAANTRSGDLVVKAESSTRFVVRSIEPASVAYGRPGSRR